jgi:hypothetical protein
VVHKLPADLRKALITNTTALDAWKDITPLARNEFICWVEDAKPAAGRGASTASAPAGSDPADWSLKPNELREGARAPVSQAGRLPDTLRGQDCGSVAPGGWVSQ